MSGRSTRASGAVGRLKRRTGREDFETVTTGSGLFYLTELTDTGAREPLCEPKDLDQFVVFVDSVLPAPPRKATKNDLAFEAQLKKPDH